MRLGWMDGCGVCYSDVLDAWTQRGVPCLLILRHTLTPRPFLGGVRAAPMPPGGSFRYTSRPPLCSSLIHPLSPSLPPCPPPASSPGPSAPRSRPASRCVYPPRNPRVPIVPDYRLAIAPALIGRTAVELLRRAMHAALLRRGHACVKGTCGDTGSRGLHVLRSLD